MLLQYYYFGKFFPRKKIKFIFEDINKVSLLNGTFKTMYNDVKINGNLMASGRAIISICREKMISVVIHVIRSEKNV